MQAAIDCQGLSKRYKNSSSYALKNLSLQVQAGEVYGFLGPNGAGKSTAIRTLLNFIQPTSGQAHILGLDIVEDSVVIKSKLGYLAGEVALYENLTGEQLLDYLSDLQPLKQPGYLKQLVNRFGAQLDQPISELSKGNRQKLGILQAFMHQPDIFILDEPTSGLDPLMQEEFFKLIKEVKDSGSAVFVSSHNFTEVLRMCDRIAFIKDGELVGEESIAKLQAKAAHTFTISFLDKVPVSDLKAIKGLKVVNHDDNHISVEIRGELSPLFKVLGKHKVSRLDQHEANLEREFLRYYRGADT